MNKIGDSLVFGGNLQRYEHVSDVLHCKMVFSIFLPNIPGTIPILWYLSGLTCNDQNFCTKGTIAFKAAAEHGIAVVVPDTSPRGLGIEGEEPDWDFGTGAGMYVDATQAPWTTGYFMYSYITKELPALLAQYLPKLDMSRQSITGHSMGGHGALVIALRNPSTFRSVSAFAPICHASAVPWGQKTFSAYLGSKETSFEAWKQYDALELARNYKEKDLHILVHQGACDNFYEVQLSTKEFEAVVQENSNLTSGKIHIVDGYDHSYYFVSSFLEEHVAHHAKYLK